MLDLCRARILLQAQRVSSNRQARSCSDDHLHTRGSVWLHPQGWRALCWRLGNNHLLWSKGGKLLHERPTQPLLHSAETSLRIADSKHGKSVLQTETTVYSVVGDGMTLPELLSSRHRIFGFDLCLNAECIRLHHVYVPKIPT